MIPGMNPRDMAKAMKKMGIKQEEIDAEKVVIHCPDKEIIIINPQVSKIDMMGQETFQVSGQIQEQEKDHAPSISEDDVKTVMEQTGVDHDTALDTIRNNDGDLARAILELKKPE